MASDRIAYTAYTQTCTFSLDGEGFCRRILMRGKQNPKAAKRCVGAQYVASLVLGEAGGLAEMPTVGAPLIFARIDEGRVSLVRTGPLERFVAHGADDVENRERELATLARTSELKAIKRKSVPPPIEEIEIEEIEPDEEEEIDAEDVVYHDAADRTQQLRHLIDARDHGLTFDDDKTALKKSSPLAKKKGMLPRRQ